MAYTTSYIDPIAQSFLISNDAGVFVTSIDIFFASKDDTAPVILQIRKMVNGVPSSVFDIPNGQVILTPSEVNSNEFETDLETVQNNPTRFTFETPVYLGGGKEYAMVILTNTDKYNVYVAKAGDFVLGRTDKRIMEQPAPGSFFMSQNSTTYTADQERDLMYRVRGASFNSGAVAVVNNRSLETQQLITDPIMLDSGSTSVTIAAPLHGLSVGDEIILRGFDSADSAGGFSLANINGPHNVTKVDERFFQFTMDSSALGSGFFGGTGGTVTSNIVFEKAIVQIPSYLPLKTGATLSAKFTEGHSVIQADQGQGGYGLPSTFQAYPFNEILEFNDPKMVANTKHETDNMANEKSFQAEIEMNTISEFVSPVLDITEMNIETHHSIIDNQDSAISSSLFNTPVYYISEENAYSGSALSKHLTLPVILENPAVGIKILLAANVPPVASIDVYYRVLPSGSDLPLSEINFVKTESDTIIPKDNNPEKYRQYEYTIGGLGGAMEPFTAFQVKLVLNSLNPAKAPKIRDLRTIALGT